jgi:hypothetical protein
MGLSGAIMASKSSPAPPSVTLLLGVTWLHCARASSELQKWMLVPPALLSISPTGTAPPIASKYEDPKNQHAAE